jgi:hypothetical protein
MDTAAPGPKQPVPTVIEQRYNVAGSTGSDRYAPDTKSSWRSYVWDSWDKSPEVNTVSPVD